MSEATKAPDEHRAAAPRRVRCAVLTISDSRGPAEDRSGAAIRAALEAAGHEVALARIVKDEPRAIRAFVKEAGQTPGVRAVLATGGTGIAPRDRTHETISKLLEKRLDGFGELFRALSYEEIGPAAMLSRAVAGTRGALAIFSMPGSTGAVRLAMEKLIVPELGHIAGLLEKSPPRPARRAAKARNKKPRV